jgi:hypothetical protein
VALFWLLLVRRSPEAQRTTRESVGAAATVATKLGPTAGAYLREVSDAFLSGLGIACLVAAAVAATGAILAARFLPARARERANDTAASPLSVEPEPQLVAGD